VVTRRQAATLPRRARNVEAYLHTPRVESDVSSREQASVVERVARRPPTNAGHRKRTGGVTRPGRPATPFMRSTSCSSTRPPARGRRFARSATHSATAAHRGRRDACIRRALSPERELVTIGPARRDPAGLANWCRLGCTVETMHGTCRDASLPRVATVVGSSREDGCDVQC
jgi:hypothetical protein